MLQSVDCIVQLSHKNPISVKKGRRYIWYEAELFARCSLPFARYSLLFLVARYFSLVARYFLLVASYFLVYRML